MADNRALVTPPPPARRHPAAPPAQTVTVSREALPLLVARKVLTPEQAEKIEKLARLEMLPLDEAIVRLGILTEVPLTQALAEAAGLRFQRINPLDLDLEVVTSALPAGFARKNGIVAIGR